MKIDGCDDVDEDADAGEGHAIQRQLYLMLRLTRIVDIAGARSDAFALLVRLVAIRWYNALCINQPRFATEIENENTRVIFQLKLNLKNKRFKKRMQICYKINF